MGPNVTVMLQYKQTKQNTTGEDRAHAKNTQVEFDIHNLSPPK